jgi:hypothetical protein
MMLLPLALFFAAAASAQGQGTLFDCKHVFVFTGTGTQLAANTSTTNPCRSWGVSFTSTGFATVTLAFGTSPDSFAANFSAVPNVVCTPTTPPAPGCVSSGSSPLTGKTGAATYTAFDTYYGVNVSSVSGSGTVTVTVYGYKGLGAPSGGGDAATLLFPANPKSKNLIAKFGTGIVALQNRAEMFRRP